MNQEIYDKARELALRHLGKKDKTSGEIRIFLQKKHYADDVIEGTLNWLIDAGVVDDRRYTENFILESIRKRKGRRLIKSELAMRGIERALAEEQLDVMINNEMEYENALEEAERMLRTETDDIRRNMERVMRRLSYLGYEHDLIFELIDRIRRRAMKD